MQYIAVLTDMNVDILALCARMFSYVCVFAYCDIKTARQSVGARQHKPHLDKSNSLYFKHHFSVLENKHKNSYLLQTCFITASNNRENMKSDLWGLDLLTPVFHCGNQSSNCFWGVPDPFALLPPFQSRKHDLYLTHVLFSSPFMSAPSLRRCLFGVDAAFEFETLGEAWLIEKTALFFIFYQGLWLDLQPFTETLLQIQYFPSCHTHTHTHSHT